MLFAVASALVNCTNSYDYEEPDPKMVELAKYAKQHVPEQHPKVRGRGRAWGSLRHWDRLTGASAADKPHLSGFLSLWFHIRQSVL